MSADGLHVSYEDYKTYLMVKRLDDRVQRAYYTGVDPDLHKAMEDLIIQEYPEAMEEPVLFHYLKEAGPDKAMDHVQYPYMDDSLLQSLSYRLDPMYDWSNDATKKYRVVEILSSALPDFEATFDRGERLYTIVADGISSTFIDKLRPIVKSDGFWPRYVAG